jgi:pimeloyl-ACP methyl ester carboxylesterase
VIRTLCERADPERAAPVQIVLLPAAYAGPEDFCRAGFGRAVRARRLNVDVTFAALDVGHVTDRSVVPRVLAEVIAPLRAAASQLWLGGISLGGYVALCCAEAESQGLAGLCLFAPYLGSHIIISEVAEAGIRAWRAGDLAEDDDERRVWRFLQRREAATLPLHLGLGREDRFLERHQLLANALDPAEVDMVPGGHDWPTWLRLWENFLDARIAPRP